MLAILQKELNSFFTSLIAYVIIGFFLLIMGLVMWVLPYTNLLDAGYADLQPLFDWGPYILLFLVPAITMGSLAEERKMGTLEVLLTSGVTPIQIVFGKYLACLLILALTFLLTLVYYVSIYYLAHPIGNIDTAGIIGSYIGLFLLAASFASVGMLASAVTENQIIAFLLGVFACVLLYQGFEAWSTLQTWKNYAWFIAQCGLLSHYESLSRGVIDSRDVIYFMSVIIAMLVITSWLVKYIK